MTKKLGFQSRLLLSVAFCLLLTLTGLGQGFVSASPEDVGMSADRLARIDHVMFEQVRDGKIAGAVTIVLRDGKLAHYQAHGYLDAEAKRPMPRDAIFRIASMTKAITSVAVMMLFEEGRLTLTDPVSKFIPEFGETVVATPDPEKPGRRYGVMPPQREITIRDLLTHTAGISYGDGPAKEAYLDSNVHGWYLADHDEPVGAVVRRLAVLPFDSQPGEKWVYGYATDILGHVVEQVSGLTLAEFFERRILTPLGMRDTHFYLPEDKLDRFSPVYGLTEEGRLEKREGTRDSDYFKGPRKCYAGGAGLLSTASDYARFLQMLLNAGELDRWRLLSPKTVQMMTVNQVGNLRGDEGFGLGFSVVRTLEGQNTPGTVGAFGWGGAYFTSYWVDPTEKLVAVFMAQLLPARGSDLHAKFKALVYQSIVDSYADSVRPSEAKLAVGAGR